METSGAVSCKCCELAPTYISKAVCNRKESSDVCKNFEAKKMCTYGVNLSAKTLNRYCDYHSKAIRRKGLTDVYCSF